MTICINTANGYRPIGDFSARLAKETAEKHAAIDKARKTFRRTLTLITKAGTEQEHKEAHGLCNQAFAELSKAESHHYGRKVS